MVRNIKYKPITKDLEQMVKPNDNANIRPSIGLEKSIGEFFYLPVEDLISFHNQPRISFDDNEIQLLSDSIKEHGIRQPLTVILSHNNKYEIISGERRLKAAKLAAIERVPCIIIKDHSQAEALSLVENIHRKDLTPLELGLAYKKLLDTKIFENRAELTQKILVKKSQVSEYIRYTEFSEEIQQYIIKNNINSRDKLRAALAAYKLGNIKKMHKILGIEIEGHQNYSVIRISCSEGVIKVQDRGIKKLSAAQQEQLKSHLVAIINKL